MTTLDKQKKSETIVISFVRDYNRKKYMKKLYIILSSIICLGADYSTINRPNIYADRSSITQNINNKTVVNRSDRTQTTIRYFPNNKTTTVETFGNSKISGNTFTNGNKSITKWSNGTTTTATKIGNNVYIRDTNKYGKTITGISSDKGNSTITRWSNGVTNSNRQIGNKTLNQDRK